MSLKDYQESVWAWQELFRRNAGEMGDKVLVEIQNRVKRPEDGPKVISTCNPSGPASSWLKRWFTKDRGIER